MDEISQPPSPPPHAPPTATSTASSTNRRQGRSVMSWMKKGCLSFAVSLQESLRYVKALFVGQGKKMMARNEREATAVDLQTAKMQVEAADEAESAKERLDKTM